MTPLGSLWLSTVFATLVGICVCYRVKDFRFVHPYFLIRGAKGANDTVITTETCESGGFSPDGIPLKSFCVTGIWVVISHACYGTTSNADDPSRAFVVVGKDSCFDLPDNLELTARRFMPILQNISNFEGSAFALPSNLAFFIRLCPGKQTVIENIPSVTDWWLLTVNFDLYERNLHAFQYIGAKREKEANRTCFVTEPGNMVQIYRMWTHGETVFQPHRGTEICLPGFNETGTVANVKFGMFQSWPSESDFVSVPASGSYKMLKINESLLQTPLDTCLQRYAATVPQKPYPKFPFALPPTDLLNEMVDDEIKETAYRYMEFKVGDAVMPQLNYSEYFYLKFSNEIFAKHCCSKYVKTKELEAIRRAFRLSASYYDQFFPYQEITDPDQHQRILKSLTTCLSRPVPADPCVYINESGSCPSHIVGATFDGKGYPLKMPVDIRFEIGNLDYVTEVMWKTALFVHYYCSDFFEDPSDHSAFNTKIEAFFSPIIKHKWSYPNSVHSVYELLFNEINLKGLAESMDYCVDTAQQVSQYYRWLTRPDYDSIYSNSRKKRRASKSKGRSSDGANVPKCSTGPPFACVRNQFDVFEKKLVGTSTLPASCVSSFSHRSSSKSIHKNVFDTQY